MRKSISRTGNEVIPTETAKNIRNALDIAKARKGLVFIFGNTGRGKTFVSNTWAAENNATVITCSPPCALGSFKRQIARDLLGKAKTTGNDDDIFSYLESAGGHTLIIDEANMITRRESKRTVANILDYLRILSDNTGCGIVLIFTGDRLNDFFMKQLDTWLQQFRRRMTYHLNIPERINIKHEIMPILHHYIGDNIDKTILKRVPDIISRDGGIGALIKYLDIAKEVVRDKNTKINGDILHKLQLHYENGGQWAEDDL